MSMQRHISVEEPLRIAFYSPALPESGASNGIVTYTRIMRDAMRELGHQVFVVTTEYMENPDGHVKRLAPLSRLAAAARMQAASMLGVNRGDLWVRLNVRNAFEAARRSGVQVLELEESFGWAGDLTGKGVAIIERLHGPHLFVRDQLEEAEVKRSGDLREKAEFASFKKVQAITSPTQRLLDGLAPHGLDRSITHVIPNPIPVAPLSASWRIESADPDKILFVGRFDLCKGADIAIRAFSEAAESHPSIRLVMAGPDSGLAQPNGSRILFDDFIMSEVPPELRSRIDFLGAIPPSDVAKLRRRCAFALVTSRFENFPYSIAEAMAVGSPVLTSDTFGGATMIRDGLDGLVVPCGDIGATAEAMLKMCRNNAKLVRMGKSSYTRASEWLSPERIARETVAIYRTAIARGRSASKRRLPSSFGFASAPQ